MQAHVGLFLALARPRGCGLCSMVLQAHRPLFMPCCSQSAHCLQVVEAAKRQGLMITWNPSTVHFLQLAYETMNDLLFNVICPDASEPVHHK